MWPEAGGEYETTRFFLAADNSSGVGDPPRLWGRGRERGRRLRPTERRDLRFAGEIGTVQWTLEDGTLTFSGEGIIREAAWLEEPYRVERDDITEVIFGDGIEDFNYGLFSACGNLRSVTFGDGFTCVPSEAFVDCASLEEVRFGKNVTRIDGWAFQRCSLREVVLPEGLTLINGEAFQGCQDLESVTIPDSVTDIEESAFDGCERLTIHAREGSFAERFAAARGIPFAAL